MLATKKTISVILSVLLCLAAVAAVYLFNKESNTRRSLDQASQTIGNMRQENNELIGAQETYCGEYRKLYDAYKTITEQPNVNGSYAIPGSAKGSMDSCYTGLVDER